MRTDNGKLVLERTNCWSCSEGKVAGSKTCPTCKGTGKGKRGKALGCKECFGKGRTFDWDNPVPCPQCHGNHVDAQPETLYDTLPDAVWNGLTFKVYRQGVPMTTNETLVGIGCVFSCTDYGAAWNASDDAVIADVRGNRGQQACKVAREDGTICDHVAIVVKPGGYAVRAVFSEKIAA